MSPRHYRRLSASIVVATCLMGIGTGSPVHASLQRGQGLLGRPSPPQPQQKPGLDYFAGTWRFSWTGRESALTAGPRRGTATFTRTADTLAMKIEGTVDGGSAYQETGTLSWNEERKALSVRERLAAGAEISGVGDWSSPIAINMMIEPVTIKGQTARLRRFYSILSASSFSIAEELSMDGGPFVRLGKGDFIRQP